MRRFKKLTVGKPVIMGRNTADSLGGPLVDRINIVLTSRELAIPEFVRVTSVEEALEVAAEAAISVDAGEIMVIGGGEIYAATIAGADRMYITHVLAEVEGDVRFPEFGSEWREISREFVPAGERDSHPTEFTVYEREHSR